MNTGLALGGGAGLGAAHIGALQALDELDIASGDRVVLDQGKASAAVMASACIPGIFTPVEIEERLLVDGGLVENVPVQPLTDMGVERVVAVDLGVGHSERRPENIIEVLANAFDFALMNASKHYREHADLIVEPDLSALNSADFDRTDELIERGYEEARRALVNEWANGTQTQEKHHA